MFFIRSQPECERDKAPHDDRPTHWTAKDPRRSTAIMNFKIFPSGFWCET